jgi:hypothetical protein
MKLTTIAAKLRMTAAEMETLAALGADMDYPDKFVLSFINSWLTDPSMFSTLSRELHNNNSSQANPGAISGLAASARSMRTRR